MNTTDWGTDIFINEEFWIIAKPKPSDATPVTLIRVDDIGAIFRKVVFEILIKVHWMHSRNWMLPSSINESDTVTLAPLKNKKTERPELNPAAL